MPYSSACVLRSAGVSVLMILALAGWQAIPCSAQFGPAQQTASPGITPIPNSPTKPMPQAAPFQAAPVVDIPSPADQLEMALNEHNLDKVTALLTANPSLAKTLSSDGSLPLVTAVKNYYNYDNNSIQIVQKLLDNGADVNVADRSGITPLMSLLTPGNNNADMLLMLLNKGADFKARNAKGENSLLVAVESNNSSAVTLLLNRGADVNSCDTLGNTALDLAIFNQNRDIIDTLLNAGANVNLRNFHGDMPIHLAMRLTTLQSTDMVSFRFGPETGRINRSDTRRGNPLLVPQLLDRGAQINARDQSGMTPLLFALLNCDKINYAVLMQRHAAMDTLTKVFNAAATNDTTTLARLLKTLPDAKDLRSSTGATALHVAALWNAPEAARLFLHNGLDTSIRDAAQETPLHYACLLPQNTRVVNALLASGANINTMDIYGETPLHIAVHSHATEILRLLIAHKAALDIPNNSGETPLGLTVRRDDLAMSSLLISAGANVNNPGRYGGDFLIEAIQNHNFPLVMLLVAKGANVNYVSDQSEDNPLVAAVQTGNKDIIQFLLDKGADATYITRWNNRSLLSLVDAHNSNGIADLLKQHGAK